MLTPQDELRLSDAHALPRADRTRPAVAPVPHVTHRASRRAVHHHVHVVPAPVRTHVRTHARTPVHHSTGAAPAGAAAWAASARAVRLRRCESGGNYASVNRSGKYRGAYQMDRSFWVSYGGNPSITPDQGSKAEQDGVAYRGYLARGWTPWPQCGYV